MNLYLAKISYNGGLYQYRLVKAKSKTDAAAKIQDMYYYKAIIEILDTIE